MFKSFLPFAISVACIALSLVSCRKDGNYRQCSGVVWTTAYSIVYESESDMSDSIIAVMQRVEKSLSPFDSVSVVSKINRNESMAVDTLLQRVFAASQEVCRLSGGAFDPTVAPIVNLWGFGYDNMATEPTQAQIDSALTSVGILECVVADGVMRKRSPATEFNFSAITKGYGCDLIGEMLRRNGVENYMVEIGGEIALRGVNSQGKPWHIQIDAPVEEKAEVRHTPMSVVPLTNCGVATSGNYRNFRETSAGKTWHTISPVTGRPVSSATLSATVIAPTCMMADALATACMAMPSDDALKMIEAIDGVEAMIVVNGGGNFVVRKTSSFPAELN